MQDIDLRRKVMTPALPSTILHRPRLLTMLKETIDTADQRNASRTVKKLILLCAPAGYGKTTLLTDFAASTSLPCCWYSLEDTDTDYVIFLRTLLASLRQVFPQLSASLDTLFTNFFARDVPSPAHAYQPAIDALCQALASETSERFVLLLCNYEQINESTTMTDLVHYFLARLPTHVTLILESRALPHLDVNSLSINDELLELDSDTLRFSAQEIVELARLHHLSTLTMADAEQLAASFDGWITGILLGTHLGNHRALSSSSYPRQASGTSLRKKQTPAAHRLQNLFAYVANEVFQRDQVLYHFLQSIALLQYMEAEMCNALLDLNDAAELLARSEQQGLFISSFESENESQTIYIMHPVIRDLLQTQCCQRDPARFLELQRRATQLWMGRQNYEQAMHHASAGQAFELATQIILTASKQLLQQGQVETLTHWLHALPPATKENSPRLLLVEVATLLARHQYAQVLLLLDKISALLDEISDDPEILLLRAEAMIQRGRVLCQTGDYLQARTLCQQVLQDLPEQEIELCASARMWLGICTIRQGDFPTGILHLQGALHHWDTQLPMHQMALIHGFLVNAYYLTGNFALAEYHLTRALNYSEQLQDRQSKFDNLLRKGILYQDQGQYAEAETIFEEALALVRTSDLIARYEAFVLTNLGALHLDQQRYTQALTVSEDALALVLREKNVSSLTCTIFCHMAMAHLFLGDSASALLLLEKIDLQSTDETMVSYERAARDVTYGLILLYQQRYEEASACLSKLEKALSIASLQRELMMARLRLAACHLALRQKTKTLDLLETVTLALAHHTHYKQTVLVELQWLPAILSLIKQQPQCARLRELLALEAEMPERVHDVPSMTRQASSPTRLPQLTVRAFGEPAVLINNQPIKHWRMTRAMELFFFLFDTDRPLSKERIITELWSSYDEQTNQTFYSTIHQLRKLLGQSSIHLQADGYTLNLNDSYDEHIWYDVQAFYLNWSQAEQALDRADEAAARVALLQMVELYQGDYGRPFYNKWCTLRRDELRTNYLEARRRLAQIAWRKGELEECIGHWHHLLDVDDCLEEAHLGLMRCYLRQGKRSTALRQYRQCQETLQQELGTEPEPTLQQLYRDLVSSLATSYSEGR